MAQLSSHQDWSKELLAVQSAIAATPGDVNQVMDLIVAGALRVIPHAGGAGKQQAEGNVEAEAAGFAGRGGACR